MTEGTRYEDEVEEQGYKIGSQGETRKQIKDQKIRLIDERQEDLEDAQRTWRKEQISIERERKTFREGNYTAMGKDNGL